MEMIKMVTKRIDLPRSKIKSSFLTSLLLQGAFFVHLEVMAAPKSLDSFDPAQIEKRLKEQTLPQPQTSWQDKLQLPKTVSGRPPEGAGAIQVVPGSFVFEGGTIFGSDVLAKLSQDMEGQQVPLQKIYDLADQITLMYRQAGYVFSRAVVVPQEITRGGAVKIRLVEGYIADIKYEGDEGLLKGLRRGIAEKILESRPLRMADLEKVLLLLKERPGSEIEAVMQPSQTTPEASTLVLVAKKKPFSASLSGNNYGSPQGGPLMYTVAVSLGLPQLWDHQWSLMYTGAKEAQELKSLQASYEQLLNTRGTTFSVSGGVTDTKPGGLASTIGKTSSVGVSVRHPFVRSREMNLSMDVGFSSRNVRQDSIHETKRTKIRSVSLSVSFDKADRWGNTLVNLQGTQGLKGLGASRRADVQKTPKYGRPDFTKLTLSLSRNQMLKGNLSLFLAAESQYAFNPLLDAERFSHGGTAFSRGYTASPNTGDTGIREHVELRYSLPSLTGVGSPLSGAHVYGFWGCGTLWNRRPDAYRKDRITFQEVGVGSRLGLGSSVQASFEQVWPLRRKVGTQRFAPELFFGLSCRI